MLKHERFSALAGEVEMHLSRLTIDITDRSVGSQGNQAAAAYVRECLWTNDARTSIQQFQAMDWQNGPARLTVGDTTYRVAASPYSKGCDVKGPIRPVSNAEDLSRQDARGAILLLHGTVAASPFMPKNFPFYRDDDEQALIAALEGSGAAAIVAATDKKPLIEDGDFQIPSVHGPTELSETLGAAGVEEAHLVSKCRRIPSTGWNVIGQINPDAKRRIVVTAHLDAKKGAPGALDNGTGVATLLVMARLLLGYRGPYCIELVALNGEDHYAVPGQRAYLNANPQLSNDVVLHINIDGVGYVDGPTAYSFFGLHTDQRALATPVLLGPQGMCEGMPWYQGDHAMFVQAGCPAIAVTSHWLLENIETQTITHSEADCLDVVDPKKVAATAVALSNYIETLP